MLVTEYMEVRGSVGWLVVWVGRGSRQAGGCARSALLRAVCSLTFRNALLCPPSHTGQSLHLPWLQGGSLSHNLRAKRVSWYRRGKKVRLRARVG